MTYIEIVTREGTRRVPLERERLSIGRLSYNDVVLSSGQISRQHAELRYISGRWWIADLHSTNGLHLKGRRVSEHQFNNGDEIALSPEITVRFVEDGAPPPQTAPAAPVAVPVSPVSPARAAPPPPPSPFPPLSAFVPQRPRTPFSDDEEPYVPPGMATMGPAVSPVPPVAPAPPGAYGAAGGSVGSSYPLAPPSPYSRQHHPTQPAGGYPAPPGPLVSGGTNDPYRRATSGPASTLLHVCQTCGQLTAPDSVYCQNCHHAITYECSNCRLSLLPVQDRCPRCQTPNAASVRRAHRATGA